MKERNKKISFNQLVFATLYYRYRDFLLPLGVVGVCLLLFFYLLIPQIQGWFAMQDEMAVDTDKLAVLKQNLNAVTLLDGNALDIMLQTSTQALPPTKDFAGMVLAISNAAATSGTLVDDYSIQVGSLSDSTPVSRGTLVSGAQTLQIALSLHGNLVEASRFISALKQQLPLSDVISIATGGSNTVQITVIFYYEQLPKIAFDDTARLQVATGKEETFLRTLTQSESIPSSSSAVILTPTPTIIPNATPTSVPAPSLTGTTSTTSAQ